MTTALTPRDVATARNWIAGQWSDVGSVEESVNPSDGQVLGRYTSAGLDEALGAIGAARRAFDTTSWSRDQGLRARAINELADRLEARVGDIALTLAREGGKLLAQTTWEVSASAEWLRYAAASALLQNAGRAAEVAPGTFFQSTPEPVGVVGLISPWNSPIILTIRALGPALAAGCSVVLKLPGQTGITNGLFAEVVASTTALPAGVLNVVTEVGNAVSPALVESADVDVVSYTGSTTVGRLIAQAGAKTLKRMSLELGGKTPLVVLDDADVDAVVPHLMQAVLAMNGQFCVTGSRVLVHRDLADRLRDRLVTAYNEVRVGVSEDPQSDIGPLIDKKTVARVDGLVEEAGAYARVLVRGGPVATGPLAAGAFYRPSLLEVDDVEVPIVQQELFAPVQTFEVVDDDADAVARANATEFGLAAAVFTRDETRGRQIARELRAATVWTNCWGVLSEQFEQTGFKQSGYGSLCGLRAIEEFQQLKVYAQRAPSPDGALPTAGG